MNENETAWVWPTLVAAGPFVTAFAIALYTNHLGVWVSGRELKNEQARADAADKRAEHWQGIAERYISMMERSLSLVDAPPPGQTTRRNR